MNVLSRILVSQIREKMHVSVNFTWTFCILEKFLKWFYPPVQMWFNIFYLQDAMPVFLNQGETFLWALRRRCSFPVSNAVWVSVVGKNNTALLKYIFIVHELLCQASIWHSSIKLKISGLLFQFCRFFFVGIFFDDGYTFFVDSEEHWFANSTKTSRNPGLFVL